MKIKLLNLLNKILKKFAFLGFFSFTTSTSAQTTYQCLPCPEGMFSNPGAVGLGECYPLNAENYLQAAGTKTFTSSNGTVDLLPGWYRLTLKSADGSAGSSVTCGTSVGEKSSATCYCGKSYSTQFTKYVAATASGGAAGTGMTISFLIYVSGISQVSYTYNSGAPTVVITNSVDGTKRTYTTQKGGNGTAGVCPGGTTSSTKTDYKTQTYTANYCAWSSRYPSCYTASRKPDLITYTYKTQAGTAGVSRTNTKAGNGYNVEGWGAYDTTTTTESLSSAGMKITRL